MERVIDPPREVAGIRLRAVCEVEVAALALPGGLAGHGVKHPVALIIGRGPAARLVGLDGAPRNPAEFGLRPEDLS